MVKLLVAVYWTKTPRQFDSLYDPTKWFSRHNHLLCIFVPISLRSKLLYYTHNLLLRHWLPWTENNRCISTYTFFLVHLCQTGVAFTSQAASKLEAQLRTYGLSKACKQFLLTTTTTSSSSSNSNSNSNSNSKTTTTTTTTTETKKLHGRTFQALPLWAPEGEKWIFWMSCGG